MSPAERMRACVRWLDNSRESSNDRFESWAHIEQAHALAKACDYDICSEELSEQDVERAHELACRVYDDFRHEKADPYFAWCVSELNARLKAELG